VRSKTVHCGLAPSDNTTSTDQDCGHLHMDAAHVFGFDQPLKFEIESRRGRNNRPVYRARSRGAFLFYFKSAGHHQWVVGADMTKDTGWMVANDNAMSPLGIRAQWEVADGQHWVRRNLSIACVHWCSSIELRANIRFDEAYSKLLGVYVLAGDSQFGRPVYKAEAAEHFLFFYGEQGREQWIVGPNRHGHTGWLYTNEKAFRPENITGGLTVNGQKASTVSISCAAGGCVCRCGWQPGCCAHEGFTIGRGSKMGKMLGPPFHGDSTANKCCQRCTHNPGCGSWEFSSDGTCILFPETPTRGVLGAATEGSYVRNRNLAIITWAGPRAPTGAGNPPACARLDPSDGAESTRNKAAGGVRMHILRGFHRARHSKRREEEGQ
jgi:hypothetical protein